MTRKIFLATIAVWLLACSASMYAAHYADMTLGHVGCERREITASDWESSAANGSQTWKASCRGREYFCSTGGEGMLTSTQGGTSCVEAVPPK